MQESCTSGSARGLGEQSPSSTQPNVVGLCLQEKNSEEMRRAGTWMTIIASVLQDIRKMIVKTVDKGINPSIMKMLG